MCVKSAYVTPDYYVLILPVVILRGRGVRELPPDNGSIRTGADEGAVVGADLDAADAATVSYSYVGYYTFHIVPHLYQFVISTCQKNMSEFI